MLWGLGREVGGALLTKEMGYKPRPSEPSEDVNQRP